MRKDTCIDCKWLEDCHRCEHCEHCVRCSDCFNCFEDKTGWRDNKPQ